MDYWFQWLVVQYITGWWSVIKWIYHECKALNTYMFTPQGQVYIILEHNFNTKRYLLSLWYTLYEMLLFIQLSNHFIVSRQSVCVCVCVWWWWWCVCVCVLGGGGSEFHIFIHVCSLRTKFRINYGRYILLFDGEVYWISNFLMAKL